MGAFGPGNIITNLIIIGSVLPWFPSDGVIGAGGTAEVNFGNAIAGIFAGKESVEGKV